MNEKRNFYEGTESVEGFCSRDTLYETTDTLICNSYGASSEEVWKNRFRDLQYKNRMLKIQYAFELQRIEYENEIKMYRYMLRNTSKGKKSKKYHFDDFLPPRRSRRSVFDVRTGDMFNLKYNSREKSVWEENYGEELF